MKRHFRVILMLLGSAIAVVLFSGLGSTSAIGKMPAAADAFDSYLFLYDADSGDYVYTFTVPAVGAGVVDLEVRPGAANTEIWFTAPGTDQLGHFVYTDTDTSTYRAYALPAGSYPLNLEVDGDFVWFTEARRNRIGRLDIKAGAIEEFEIPTPDSFPADLAISSDGGIWFTQQRADQLAKLTADGSGAPTVDEYQGPTMVGGRPYGVIVEDIILDGQRTEAVFVAQVENDRVTRFLPKTGRWLDFYNPFTDDSRTPDGPYRLAFDSAGELWGTGRSGNAIYNFGYGTYPIVQNYSVTPVHSAPHSLAVDESGRIWFTQYGAGQVGRLTLGSPVIRDYYPLPEEELSPTGIGLGKDGEVWILANRTHRVFLPIVSKAY